MCIRDRFYPSTHFGPSVRFGDDYSLDLIRTGVRIVGGETQTIEIVVGEGVISGQTTGHAGGNCFIEVQGISDLGNRGLIPVGTSSGIQGDGTWSARVPPGDYTVTNRCPGGAQHWPVGSTLDTATKIRVNHGQTVRNINFSLLPTANAGGNVTLSLDNVSAQMTFCVDAVNTAGITEVRRIFTQYSRSSGVTADSKSALIQPFRDASYKFRIWDCHGYGFDDVWYPNSSTEAGGQAIAVDGRQDLAQVVSLFGDTGPTCRNRQATIVSSAMSSTINGTSSSDVIVTFGGNDVVFGFEGDDVICTGLGDDVVEGADGRDLIDGGPGDDYLSGGSQADIIYGSHGDDTLVGGRNADRLFGDAGKDLIRGNAGADRIKGKAGNDRLIGNVGPDKIFGGGGAADEHFGGGGTDLCRDSAALVFDSCEQD